MADKQYDVSPELQRIYGEKQKQRASMRNYFLKNVHNPHRHALGEGGFLFDPALFRHQAMRAKEYDTFKPTLRNGATYIALFVLPIFVFGYFVKKQRDSQEKSFRTGQVSYKDRDFKFI